MSTVKSERYEAIRAHAEARRQRRRNRRSKRPIVVTCAAIVAGVATLGVFFTHQPPVSTTQPVAASPSPGPAQAGPTTVKPVKDNALCNGFTVTVDPHTAGSIISGGIPATLSPEDKKAFIIAHAKMDPSVLETYYNDSPVVKKDKKPAITDANIGTLVTARQNGACWTQKGQEAFKSWVTYANTASVEEVVLPASGHNTYATADGKVSQVSGPIPAGTATKLTYIVNTGKEETDNNVSTTVRNECGNVVSPAPIEAIPEAPAPPPEVEEAPPPPDYGPPPEELPPPFFPPQPPPFRPPPPPPFRPPPPPPRPPVGKNPALTPPGVGHNNQGGPGTFRAPGTMTRPGSQPRINPLPGLAPGIGRSPITLPPISGIGGGGLHLGAPGRHF